MSREAAIVTMIGIGVLMLAAMAWGWKRRSRRDAGLTAPAGEPTGDVIGEFHGLYVATTEHEAPLNRLAIRHLAFRSRVTITVTTAGVALSMPGEPNIFINKSTLVGVGRATWTIDRVVEKDGLIFVSWHVNDSTIADSYLRLQAENPSALLAALERVLPTPTATGI